MSKFDKLILRILRGASDANINFDDLRELLKKLGFQERTRSSHHIFRKYGVEEKINLQDDGGKARPYEVRQVPAILIKYRLAGED
jgi:hypothetical protein